MAKPRPRLLMLVTSTQRRGGEVFGAQIAGGLTERGWDVQLRALVRTEGPSIDAIPLVDKPREALRSIDVQVIRAVSRQIDEFEPDIVFANGGATLPISVGATVRKKRTALVYGSIGEPLFWARSNAAKRRTGFLMRRCDLITAISCPTRTQIVSGLGVDRERVVVAHSGVADQFFQIEPDPSAGPFRLLFLGSIATEKGPLTALSAFEEASRTTPMRMRFVGAGPLIDDLRAKVEQRSLESVVEIVGSVPDVRPHLGWADGLVLASESEGLPGGVLEAGAAGVPSVAFAVGGVSDVVVHGETGVLVNRADVGALTDGLALLAGDATERDRLAEAVREKVRSEFSLKASLDRYDEVLRALRKGRPIPIGES